jgi:hypothetical protein
MLSGYQDWLKYDPLLSEVDYNCIVMKLKHISSYIIDYVVPAKITMTMLLENLELDATASYCYYESCSERLTPWLAHLTLTFEIRAQELSEEIFEKLSKISQYQPTNEITRDIAYLASALIQCISEIQVARTGSDGLALLYAVDVCLLRIIERICSERLSQILNRV